MKAAPALVLFDIDGTLVRRSGPQHRQALEVAVRRVVGIEASTANIPTQGMLDRDIFEAMLLEAGLDKHRIRNHMPHLFRHAQWTYARTCPQDLRDKVCPGVVELLDAIRERGALAAIVSGNLGLIGWKKMERAGLKHYFHFGSFAERGRTRGELVKLAMKEAQANKWVARKARTTLIGDHINDIRAAKENGITSVAVATGVLSKDQLQPHGPDFLLDDLRSFSVESLF